MQVSRCLVSRACDACKRRKVKCDNGHPCANCGITNLDCVYTVPQRRRGPRTRPTPPPSRPAHPTPPAPPTPPTPTTLPRLQHDYPNPPSSGDASFMGRLASLPWMVNDASDVQAAIASLRWPRSIHEALVRSLLRAHPGSVNLLAVSNHCIDLYMQYTFPSAPLIHEQTIRRYAKVFFSDPPCFPDAEAEQECVELLRAFALVTALCAAVASVMPDTLIQHRQALVPPFLQASRETLRSFEDYDLECPTSTSMTIRLLQSTALQHTIGKSRAAWHVYGQASLIAQSLHLNLEHAVTRVDDLLERRLLRLHFWHMYTSDQLAAAIQARASVLHEPLFFGGLTLQPWPGHEVSLLEGPGRDPAFEPRLLEGFHLFRRVCCTAAQITLGMRNYDMTVENQRHKLADQYLEYTTLMDGLPTWLHASYLGTFESDDENVRFQKRSFWVQRCTILVTFHCLRIVILRQCIFSESLEVVGLSDTNGLAIKSLEMVSDFLHILEDIPLIYLQVKGEPNVERIRQVGSFLLEFIQNTDNETMKTRAQAQSRRILDILVVLNSKASDTVAG